MATRKANAAWKGSLKDGSGVMKFSNYHGPYTFASRFESGEGTNPEELVGAAIAGCFSMFLSALISGEKLVPDSIDTEAAVQLGRDDTGPVITKIMLETRVSCPGISKDKFTELAATAKTKCPISRLYAGTSIELKATLL